MLTLYDEFAGAGGSSQGFAAVPGVELIFAANHNKLAISTHTANFPRADHWDGDVQREDITRFPRADLFWASPACPPWTDARGKKRDFDRSNQQVLPGLTGPGPDDATMRARALMEEIPRYLRHWADRGRPVLAGVVENVIQCRKWDEWHRWLGEIRALGYLTRVIAFNSMHAHAPRSPRAPQSRDRLYVAYIHHSVGRVPDWDKWLRPAAHCPVCDRRVRAVQVFKNPKNDMGRYRSQYVYRCPHVACRNAIVEPDTVPAQAVIDWTIPGTRIGDREALGMRPLEDATIARIKAGIARYWAPLLTPAGGTWRTAATPLDTPMPTRTTRETDGLAVPALMVPVEGRDGKSAVPAHAPMRTQTARNETGVATLPPFQVSLRGGGCKDAAQLVTGVLGTVTASGNHHGLVTPLIMRNNTVRDGVDAGYLCSPVDEHLRTITSAGHQSLLVPYNGTGAARPPAAPIGAFPTRDRWALASPAEHVALAEELEIEDVRFRMLEPHEIQAGMAFHPGYRVLGTAKRDVVRQLGNAVTPPVAELIGSALVEAITGEDLEVAA